MTQLSSLCVYCGSAAPDPVHAEAARDLGRMAAERGVDIVFGGGRVGLMGLVAESAMDAGGRVIGIIPEFLQRREVGYAEISELIVVDDMHSRKTRMFDLSDAFCVLPGGLGTLDETIEVATWKQLALHDKPIVLLNQGGFWDPLLDLIRHQARRGYVQQENLALIEVADSVQGVFEALSRAGSSALPAQTDRL